LIHAFPDDLERDAATGHLVLDTIESDDLTPEEEAGIAEGEADIAAGRVYTEEEFEKRVAWKDEPAAAPHVIGPVEDMAREQGRVWHQEGCDPYARSYPPKAAPHPLDEMLDEIDEEKRAVRDAKDLGYEAKGGE
jgi:hypothetical protein